MLKTSVRLNLTPVPTTPEPVSKTTPLLLHARLIDDAIQIWDTAMLSPNTLNGFTGKLQAEMKFGILEWEAEPPKREVNFLDLTIRIEADGNLTFKTYVKPQNLFLYIPLQSAHPKGVLKSLIHGRLQNYAMQNSLRADFIAITKALFVHLQKRGYTTEILSPMFRDAAATIDRKTSWETSTDYSQDKPQQVSENQVFIHWEYHPKDIGRAAIRSSFQETLAPILIESGIQIDQLTIAYSQPRSIGQCLTKTQLEEAQNDRVSSYLE
jgi:hypothetical protein